MSVELIRKPITLEEATKKESVQVIKERDLIVPDGKPDLQSIVQLDGDICIDQIDVSQDRVMYRGNIDICILYKTMDNPKCFYTMKGTIPMEDFVIVEGVNKDQRVDFSYEIEHMSYNILNERKINVKAIMQITVMATGCKETTIITDVQTESPIEIKQEQIEIVSLCHEKEDKTIIKEDLTVASSKPCIGEILKTCLQIQDEQIKRTEDEIKYNGMIEVITMYNVAGDEDIQLVTHRVPFEGVIEAAQDEDEMYWDCKLSVNSSFMQVTPDYDGEDRIIECEFIVTAKYCTYNKSAHDTVSDIYCPGKTVNSKEKALSYMNLKDKVEMDMPKKESITLEEEYPEGVEVVNAEIRPTVEEKILQDGQLTLKGILEIKLLLLYKTEEENILDTVINVVPFTQSIGVVDIKGKAIIMPCVEARNINIYAQTKKEVVLEYRLSCAAQVYEQSLLNIVEEIEIEDMSKEQMDAYPSMTVYQVKKGDTLWNLAKRYNTTVKDIQEINDIDTPESLREGQKIIILKKIHF